MRFVYGSIAFTVPEGCEATPELFAGYADRFTEELAQVARPEAAFLFSRRPARGAASFCYAFSPAEGFAEQDDAEAAERLSARWGSAEEALAGLPEAISASPLSEGRFFAEANFIFLSAKPDERLRLQHSLLHMKELGGSDFSAETLKTLDVVFAYQPPAQRPEASAEPAPVGESDGDASERAAKDAQAFLERLDALTGLAEFKAYMRELEATRPFLSRWKGRADFPTQHLLFSVDRGNGCTTAVTLLHEYLEQSGLHGQGEGRSQALRQAEHHFVYPPDDPMQKQQITQALSDFGDEVSSVSPGVLAVHIEEWLNKLESPYFAEFLEICREHRHDVVFVFIVPYLEEGVLARVRSRISDILNVRTLRFHPYTLEELTLAARKQLGEYGIGWDDSADAPFQHLLAEERSDRKFYGMRTVNKLGTELVLMKANNICVRHLDAPPDRLTAADFSALVQTEAPAGGFEQLDALIGLGEVKKRIRELVASIQAEKAFAHDGEKHVAPCLHMLFTGSPGTGKTTVARIVGQIFREAGLLRVGDLIEVNRFDLVGEYIGTTGPKTVERCRSAMGSILFIDEAYLLSPTSDPNDRDTGKEAIGALVAEMENNRDRFMVIMAGYGDEMERMLGSNPGLRGRIPHSLHFPNYSREELYEIFKAQLRHYDADDALMTKAERFFMELGKSFLESKEFGNARFVRNLVERMRMKALLQTQGAPGRAGGRLRLTALDLESALSDEDMRAINKKEKKVRIGFVQ